VIDIYRETWELNSFIVWQFNQPPPKCIVCDADMRFFKFTPCVPLEDKPIRINACPNCGFLSGSYDNMNNSILTRKVYTDLKLVCRGFEHELMDIKNRNNLDELVQYLPDSPIIIDMGSGSGGFEYYAKEKNPSIKVISFEVCKELIDFGKTKGMDIYSVDITNEREIRNKLEILGIGEVDCIYSDNSLEHLLYPNRVLEVWKGLLKNGGYIYLTVPAMEVLYNSVMAYQALHLSYFNTKTLTRLVENTGMRVVSSVVSMEQNNAGTGSLKFLVQK